MDRVAVLAYVLLLGFLCLKYGFLIGLQRSGRMRSKLFRWPEDARAFGGAAANGAEDPQVERAQRALDNTSESQPLFLAIAATWIVLGAEAAWAIAAFGAYALFRGLHTWFLLYPRQPARTRVFGASQLVLLALLADCVRRAI